METKIDMIRVYARNRTCLASVAILAFCRVLSDDRIYLALSPYIQVGITASSQPISNRCRRLEKELRNSECGMTPVRIA